jgi:hypothetical protein
MPLPAGRYKKPSAVVFVEALPRNPGRCSSGSLREEHLRRAEAGALGRRGHCIQTEVMS